MLNIRKILLSSACAFLLGSSAHVAFAAPIVFNFDADTQGTMFGSDTDPGSGLTMSYLGAGAVCNASGFHTLSGNALSTDDCVQAGEGEFIQFSSPLSSVSFNYATDGTGPINLIVALSSNINSSAVLTLDPLQIDDYEGFVTISGIGPFDLLIFDQGVAFAPAYALDNITAITATPEPSSIVLLGTGMLGFVGLVRRRFAA